MRRGLVLVAGGYSGGYLSSAELYDPLANNWLPTSPMTNGRAYHGALLDAQLLAEVYLAMTRGQETLGIEARPIPQAKEINLRRGPLRVQPATDTEVLEHVRYLQELSAQSGETLSW